MRDKWWPSVCRARQAVEVEVTWMSGKVEACRKKQRSVAAPGALAMDRTAAPAGACPGTMAQRGTSAPVGDEFDLAGRLFAQAVKGIAIWAACGLA